MITVGRHRRDEFGALIQNQGATHVYRGFVVVQALLQVLLYFLIKFRIEGHNWSRLRSPMPPQWHVLLQKLEIVKVKWTSQIFLFSE